MEHVKLAQVAVEVWRLGQRLDAEIMRLAGLSGSLLKPVRLSRLEECLLRVLTHDDSALSLPSPAETAFLHRRQGTHHRLHFY